MRLITKASFLLLGISLLNPVRGQEKHQARDLQADSLQQRFASPWRIVDNCFTGSPSFIYGGRQRAPFTPSDREEFEALARHHVDQNQDFFGFDSSLLQVKQVKTLRLSNIGSSDKVAISFEQMAGALKVFNSSVTVLLEKETGDLLAMHNAGFSNVELAAISPVLHVDLAIEAAQFAYLERFGVPGNSVDKVELLVVGPSAYFGSDNPLNDLGPTPSYLIELSSPDSTNTDELPIAGRVFISAQDLTLFKIESTIYSSISGNVKAYVNLGPEPPTTTNQEQAILPYLWVRRGGPNGTTLATTNANGNFSISSDSETLFFALKGPYVTVSTQAGDTVVLTIPSANSTSPVNALLNQGQGEYTSAQTSAFQWVNAFRQFVRATDSEDDTMDFQVRANVNLNNNCNAYWDGNSINLFRAGSGCANTSYRSIILHEEGHWANDLYNGYPSGAFHEGVADVWASYIADDPCLGMDIDGPGAGCARDGNQAIYSKCPGDCNEDCHGGEVHDEGEPIASALWKVRVQLKLQFGDNPGRQIANLLFLSWMQAYDDLAICDEILDHWLALDDNNGNISDLTPHFAAINAGFSAQGWPVSSPPGPAIPANVQASDASSCNHIQISWSPAALATSYSIWRSTYNNIAAAHQLTIDDASPFTDNNVQQSTTYYYWVRGINEHGISPFSSSNAGSLAVAPSQPNGVVATDGAYCDKVRISWNQVSNAASYSIWRSTEPFFQIAQQVGTANASPFDDFGGLPEQHYFYWVRAVTNCGSSSFSALNVGWKTTPPPAPSNVLASDGTICNGIEVSWNPVAGAQSYSIWASTTASPASALQVGTDNQSPFLHTGMSPGATRYYWVKAVVSCGSSNLSSAFDSGSRSPSVTSAAPSNVQASDGAFCNRVQVTWSLVSNATQYSVWRAQNNNSQNASLIGISTTSLYEDFPANTDSYYYWVKAENGCGVSPFSSLNVGYRKRAPIMQGPVVASNGSGCHSIQVSWPTITNASFYKIYRGTSPNEANATWVANDNESPYIDNNVQDGVSYSYFIRAANDCGVSTTSAWDNGFAGATVSAPSGLAASNNICDLVQLNWNAVPGASNYQVLRSNSVNGSTAVLLASPTQASFADTTAVPGVLYWYWVKAQSGCNTSNVSNYKTGKRLACD